MTIADRPGFAALTPNHLLIAVIVILLGGIIAMNTGVGSDLAVWESTASEGSGVTNPGDSAAPGSGTEDGTQLGQPGTAHDHMQFSVLINGEELDFSQDRYQLQSRRVHFEANNGEKLHVHATGVTIGLTLQTLGIEMNSTCLSVPQRGTFCEGDGNELVVTAGGRTVEEPSDYVLQDGENVTIRYGP